MQTEVFDLGLINYKSAWDFQKEVFEAVRNQNLCQALILCQHFPVITLGRAADRKNILVDGLELSLKEIQIYEIERGGDITYHGPGQLTVYPIFNLTYFKKDIHLFLRYLEEVIIELLYDLGVKGTRYAGLTGVWVDPVRNTALSDMENKISNGVDKQKIASIGIAIRNWITFHGLSINIKKFDLDNFRLIRPCGMDIEMTSLETVSGRDIEIDNVKENLIHKFKEEEMDDKGSLARIGRGN